MLVEFCFFFQAEDGIRDLVRSRGLGDVYKRQGLKGVRHGEDPAVTKMRNPDEASSSATRDPVV